MYVGCGMFVVLYSCNLFVCAYAVQEVYVDVSYFIRLQQVNTRMSVSWSKLSIVPSYWRMYLCEWSL